jgi:hypothetical protein
MFLSTMPSPSGPVGGWRKALWRDEVPDAPRSTCTGCDAESYQYMVRSTFDNAAMSPLLPHRSRDK